MDVTTAESVALLTEEVQDLVIAYPTRPLTAILGDLVRCQDDIFTLLERPQRPTESRDMYFLAAIVSALLSKASHDRGNSVAAIAQSRTAWLCADQSGHDGLRAWVCGMQALFAYWAGRPHDSLRYSQRGGLFAQNARSSSIAWLLASESRAWAQLGNAEAARDAISRTMAAWAEVRHDDLDNMGGIARFTEARAVYFAADALTLLTDDLPEAAIYSAKAATYYSDTSAPDWAFGDAAGSDAALAIVRARCGDDDGAAEALQPVLALPPEQRLNAICQCVRRVHIALSVAGHGQVGSTLQEAIEAYTRTSLPAVTS